MLRSERRMIAFGKQMSILMRRELRQQGHTLTGKTAKDVQMQFEITSDGYRLYLPSTPSINVLEDGAKYGDKKPPFNAILDWVKTRGLPRTQSGRISKSKSLLSNQKSAAWRIHKAISLQGLPTQGAYNHTRNGHRKGFISRSISENYIETQLNLRGLVEEILEINIRNL